MKGNETEGGWTHQTVRGSEKANVGAASRFDRFEVLQMETQALLNSLQSLASLMDGRGVVETQEVKLQLH